MKGGKWKGRRLCYFPGPDFFWGVSHLKEGLRLLRIGGVPEWEALEECERREEEEEAKRQGGRGKGGRKRKREGREGDGIGRDGGRGEVEGMTVRVRRLEVPPFKWVVVGLMGREEKRKEGGTVGGMQRAKERAKREGHEGKGGVVQLAMKEEGRGRQKSSLGWGGDEEGGG